MNSGQTRPLEGETLDSAVRRELARGDEVLAATAPVLRHLLAYGNQTLFADDVIARVRGMLADLARQLARAWGDAGAAGNVPVADDTNSADRLLAGLTDVRGLLGHLHALALEDMISQQLHARQGLDPVVAPLVQALVGSGQDETQALALKFLAAQARFVRQQRRMQLPLGELPGEVLHGVLDQLAGMDSAVTHQAVAGLRADYDEAQTRLGLASRLVAGMGAGVLAALQIGHAGVALFASACAQLGGAIDWAGRDTCVLAMQAGQGARLALLLRAGGVKQEIVEENLLLLPGEALAERRWSDIAPDHAAALLAGHVSGGR